MLKKKKNKPTILKRPCISDSERPSSFLSTSHFHKQDSLKINLDQTQFLRTSSFLIHPQSTKEKLKPKLRERETRGSELTFSLFPATTRHQQRIRAAREAGKYSDRKESRKKVKTPIAKSKSHAQLHGSSSLKRISLVMPPNNQSFFPGYISAPGTRKRKEEREESKHLAMSCIDGGFSVEEGMWETDSKIVEEEESDCGTARFRKGDNVYEKTPIKQLHASICDRRISKEEENELRHRELLEEVDVPLTENMLDRKYMD